MTTMRRLSLFCFASWVAVSSQLAWGRGQETPADLYSRGVHAYFAGRPSEAESLLSRALATSDHDPRLFYFRALSLLQLGRDAEARGDMAVGAALEAERLNRYSIGAALQRVQGNHRLLLEKYRRQARSGAATVNDLAIRQRAQQIRARDAGALRNRVVIPLDELLRPGEPRALSADELARRAAAARQSNAAPAPPAEQPSATSAAGEENPDNPFGDDTAQPAIELEQAPPTAAELPTPPQADPAEEDAEDNPFGDF
jgi:hypothetical protein